MEHCTGRRIWIAHGGDLDGVAERGAQSGRRPGAALYNTHVSPKKKEALASGNRKIWGAACQVSRYPANPGLGFCDGINPDPSGNRIINAGRHAIKSWAAGAGYLLTSFA